MAEESTEERNRVLEIIHLLSELEVIDLDNSSVEELAQLQYWLSKHQGSIFVKTVGRLARMVEAA